MLSRVRGASQLRRFLRRLPDAARKELADALKASGQRLAARAKGEAPRGKTGNLVASLGFRLAPKSLRLRVGQVTAAARRKAFYGYILDAGRKAGAARVRRRTPSGNTISYVMRIKPIPKGRFDFVFGRGRDFRINELPKFRAVLDRILRRAAGG